MPDLPSGTVTFLFTDIEGSTKLAQQYPEGMPALLARHHEILNQAIAAHAGFTFQIVGDSFAVAFHNASDALSAALDSQRALQQEAWSPAPIRVRMGIHTGAADLQDADQTPRYSGYATLALSQRIMSAGHGGQILLSQMSADLIGDRLPDGVRLADMHERRLKDIAHPVHLYQVNAPGLPADFPPLTAADAVRHNLPPELTAFVGRESELASLQSVMAESQNRLITIVAPGGMGKTRLALKAAARALESFPQGVYFVALDRLTSADMIVQAVADVLPISLSSNSDPKTRVLEYLSDKKVLLVLDNFEHLLANPGTAGSSGEREQALQATGFVAEILNAAPRVQMVATSRVRLNLMSETIFQIGGLTVGEGNPFRNSAVQLFAQSARQTLPQFELDDAVLPAVMEICRMVEGMPLAIVLAAAWIDTLSVREIGAEISKSIDMLETQKRDMPDRQRSVRAVIESSWNQVDENAQDVLMRLSVFRGGFTRAAAQDVAGALLRGLSQLVDKALLRRDPVTGRYSIHELVRQYVGELLARSAVQEQSAHEKHAVFFAEFMKTRDAQLQDRRAKATLEEIAADQDNIRIAWNYWTDNQVGSRLLDFVSALWFFFEVRGSYIPAIQFFGDAAKKLTGSDPASVWARAELEARQAWFTALIGLPEQGLSSAMASLERLSQINREDISVETYHCANINAIFLNKVELVMQISGLMLERAERSGLEWERGFAFIWMGYGLVLQRQIDPARRAGEKAAAIFERTGSPFGMSVASGIILAAAELAAGNMDAAKSHLSRGMQAAEEINYLRLLQRTYDGSGSAALQEHDVAHARQFFIKSMRISRECGQTREMLSSLLDLAGVQVANGNPDDALQLLAVVRNHPAGEQSSLNYPGQLWDEAEKLRAQLEGQMDPFRYRSAWETGQSRQLAQVVADILDRGED